MIVFASTLRTARRLRKIPSVASLVRVLGTVRVTDRPVGWTTCRPQDATQPAPGSVTYLHDRRQRAGGAPRSR